MKDGQKLWTREELILTINLYYKLPFGKLHSRNPNIIELAKLIGRSANAVAYKLVNFASLDPTLKKRGIKGAVNTSKLDKLIWEEFYTTDSDLPFISEKLLAKSKRTSVEKLNKISEESLPTEGKTREQIIHVRVNQSFFRKTILASYNNTCCVTGLQFPELLIASHIVPWSVDKENRMNPRNGISLNSLHDSAFDKGLLTITPEYKIKISSFLKQQKESLVTQELFLKYEGKSIILPSRFLPDEKFLLRHNKEQFLK